MHQYSHETNKGREAPPSDKPIGRDVGDVALGAAQFYDDEGNIAEAERLRLMAAAADMLTLSYFKVEPGSTVVDLGAGDSPSLGKSIRGLGGSYVALDQRADAVRSLRDSGFDARQASVVDTGLPNDFTDVAHARFVFGWLKDEQRSAAVEESWRIIRSGGRVVISDYDWGAIRGPRELLDAVELATEVLEVFGFDPYYGDKVAADIGHKAESISSRADSKVEIHPVDRRPIFKGSLRDSVVIFEQTASSMLHQLEHQGMYERANDLVASLDRLRDYAANNPDEEVQLADVVTQVFDITKTSGEVTSVETTGSLADYIELGQDDFVESSAVPGVVRAESPEFVQFVRRLQALSYVHDGIATRSQLVNGVLPLSVESEEQIARSKYFVSMDPETRQPLGCVRYIAPDPSVGLKSLPTLSRFGIDDDPRFDGAIEISAFTKELKRGRYIDPILATLGMSFDVMENTDYDKAVMCIRTSLVPFIYHIFGEQNFEDISSGRAVEIPGVDSSVGFSGLMVRAESFLPGVLEHVNDRIDIAKQAGKPRPGTFVEIRNILSANIGKKY